MLEKFDKSDLIAGLVIIAIGLFFFTGAFEYGIGTTKRMGPGFLPMVVAAITMGLGGIILIGSLRQPAPLPQPEMRSTIAVLSAIVAFGFCLERIGLMPAIILSVAISSLGDADVRPVPTVILSVVVAFGIWLIFSVALGLPMPAFRLP